MTFAWAGLAVAANDPAKLLHSLPLRFEQDAHNRWTSHGPGFAVLFDREATIIRVPGHMLQLTFAGSNPQAGFQALARLQARTNYFVGKQDRSVEAFARLQRIGLYPGIDVVYYGDGERLEYDFNLQPGADPARIRMRFEGADEVNVNPQGDIVLKLGGSEIVQKAPVVYERRSPGDVVAVESRYRMLERGEIGVALGDYDRGKPVVIDPAVLYSLYLTATNADAAVAVAVDSNGFVYLGGYTYSTDFPLGNNGYQLFPEGTNRNGWIWKLNPFAPTSDQRLVYSTYFGANLDIDLRGLAADNNGVVYFGGTTLASDLPVTAGAFQKTLANTNALNEGFVAAIDTTQSGTAGLLYCSYFGGSQIIQINGVATLGGRIYVTGWTNTDDMPIAGNGFQSTRAGGYDAFVAEFDPSQSGGASLAFSSYLGGYLTDVGRAIAVDPAGRIYVAGSTLAPDFPVTNNALEPSYSSGGDAFLSQIDPNAAALLYSTFLGGSDTDVATSVLVEPSGHVAVAGYTFSTNFPITFNAAQPAYGGNGDAFVMSLNLAAQSRPAMLVYSSYYGGNDSEVAYGLSRDPSGRYYICGYTLSQNLPVSASAINPQSIGQNVDGFLAVLDPAASLAYGSYITGPGYQIAYALATDSAGNAYVAGQTTSDVFANGPIKSTEPGNIDVFFTIIAPAATAASTRERIDVFRSGDPVLRSSPGHGRRAGAPRQP
jgi:hypothetical protein